MIIDLRNKGIAFKMIISILISVGLIFLILMYYNYSTTKKIIENNIELSVDKIAKSAIDSIEVKLQSVEKTTRTFSFLMFDRIVGVEMFERFLKAAVDNNPLIYGNEVAFEPSAYYKDSLYFGMGYSRQTGESYFYRDYQHKDWYKKVILDKEAFWTDPFVNKATNRLVCSFCMPIYQIDGDTIKIRGAMKSNVPLSWIDKITSNIKVYDNGFAVLVSNSGVFISHPNKKFINHQTLSSLSDMNNIPELKKFDQLRKNGKKGYLEIKNLNTGNKGIIAYSPVANKNWTLAILFPENEYYAELNELHRNIIFIVVAGLIVLFLLVAFISHRITKPLKKLAQITHNIGEGNFNVELPLIKSNDEVGILNNSLLVMQTELKNYVENLKKVTIAKEKIESDVRIAGEIQQSLIPKNFPEQPNKYGIDIYGQLKPAKDISGDLFDYFFIEEKYLYFAVGDVAGKGVPASQFMAVARTLLRSNSKNLRNPDQIVKEINLELSDGNDQDIFVTFFIGIMDMETGLLQYCNAGHNYPYILRKDSSVGLIDKKHGLPLGIFPEGDYKSDKLTLEEGDFIIIYTDGITEAENREKELFNDSRLKDTLKMRKFSSAKVLTNTIISEVESFVGDADQSDDITVLVISRTI